MKILALRLAEPGGPAINFPNIGQNIHIFTTDKKINTHILLETKTKSYLQNGGSKKNFDHRT